jgi:putative MFS transporter
MEDQIVCPKAESQPSMDKERQHTEPVIDQLLNQTGFGWFQIRLCLLCSMGYFAVGSELLTMVMTQAGVMETFEIHTSLEFSWLPFTANLASFLSAILVGKWSDLYGRKWPFIACISLSAVFAILCAFASSWTWLILFRSLVGFGLGGIAVVDFVVLVEVCPINWRNTACQIVFVSGCMGVIYVALLTQVPWESSFPSIETWRCMMFAGALPLLGTIALRAMVSTDTPKFLVTTGHVTEAYELVSLIARTNKGGSELALSLEEFKDRVSDEQLLAASKDERGQLIQAMRMNVTGPLAVVWMIQSMVYWGLTTFLPVFLSSAGISPGTGLLYMGVAELPGVVVATIVSQRRSRQYALIVCFLLSFLGAMLTGTALSLEWPKSVLVSSVSLFYMFLIPVWGVLFVMTPELYPVKLRGSAVGFHHMCKSIPSLIAPFIGAAILEANSPDVFMYVWAAIIGGGVSLSIWLFILSNRSKNVV